MIAAITATTTGFALLAVVGAAGLPLICILIALAKIRRYRTKAHPCETSQVPADLRRLISPWLNRLGHFGFKQLRYARLENAGYAEAFRWILSNDEEATFATVEWIVPITGSGPRVSLSFFTVQQDGTWIVTLDRRLACDPPVNWDEVRRHFATVTAQWQVHYSRIRGKKERVLPEVDRFIGMLADDEEARYDAFAKGGDFVPSMRDPNALRIRLLRLPNHTLSVLGDFFRGHYFRSCHRSDLAAPPKAKPEEIERVGGLLGLSLNQAVEQDLARYHALITVASGPLHHLRRIFFLLGSTGFLVLLFGKDQPLQIALIVIALSAVHEAGHWLPMRLFGYRGIRPVFVPFSGCSEGGRKLHAPAWQQLLVILGGPLPGLIGGLAILAKGYFSPETPLWLLDAAGIAVVLNALHLLPVLPMDGGKVIDLLVFRDLPLLRPLFTVTTALSAFLAALILKSRILCYIAMTMFGGVVWDIRTIQVVRGARKLPWAGEVHDENEALRRIFRGLRQEGQGAFIGSDGWHRKIEALLTEVIRKRPSVITRMSGGAILGASIAIPAILITAVLLGPILGDAGRLVRTAEYIGEFRKHFPHEAQTLHPEEESRLRALADETLLVDKHSRETQTQHRQPAASLLAPLIGPRLDQLDWLKAKIAARNQAIPEPILPLWMEIQCLRMEQAAREEDTPQTLHRAKGLLDILNTLEPATNLAHRRMLTNAELRVLTVIEQASASGRLDENDLTHFDSSLASRYRAPEPDVEGMILVSAWSEHTHKAALFDAAEQASLDPRFWRDLYPRIHKLRRLLEAHKTTHLPATVALARYWRLSRRVGELPPSLGMTVSVTPGEASLILDFCEEHRSLTWRRVATLSALRLEAYRKKSGNFPPVWKHSVPGGASMELIRETGNLLRLTDCRDQSQRRLPAWLTPAHLPLPPTIPALDYDCRLFGSLALPEFSAH
ncbi:MAG: hypothetical protein EAZ84_03935 [Verrucomicrobia bacterium]|nr:MAG: hypothetical protein EAZ84_03935 [Verrucomicrobiota bacterium]TAE86528.1 MAG: hypothetical protein EAZ82_10890 [Verrucomicrobiota bacterium]TAF24223.1 MAG: hypothetical protein EAZ71_11665 [Verrucomicrobiota bacterium]